MANSLEYNLEQAYLLPPSVQDVLGENDLSFFVHRAVEKLPQLSRMAPQLGRVA